MITYYVAGKFAGMPVPVLGLMHGNWPCQPCLLHESPLVMQQFHCCFEFSCSLCQLNCGSNTTARTSIAHIETRVLVATSQSLTAHSPTKLCAYLSMALQSVCISQSWLGTWLHMRRPAMVSQLGPGRTTAGWQQVSWSQVSLLCYVWWGGVWWDEVG